MSETQSLRNRGAQRSSKEKKEDSESVQSQPAASAAENASASSDSIALFKDILSGLAMSGVISLLPGAVLSAYSDTFVNVRGLLTLVPALIGMRGNVFGSLSAKMSTVVQDLGQPTAARLRETPARTEPLTPHPPAMTRTASALSGLSKELHARYDLTIAEMIFLSLLLPFFLLILSVLPAFSDFAHIHLSELCAVCAISGVASGYLMLWGSKILVFTSYARGMNPDNVAAPFITTTGDMITLPLVLLSVALVHALPPTAVTALNAVAVAVAAGLMAQSRRLVDSALFWTMVKERLPVLSVCMSISFLAGIALEGLVDELNSQKSTAAANAFLLALSPTFNALGGSSGGLFASRISTFFSQALAKKQADSKEGPHAPSAAEVEAILPSWPPRSVRSEGIVLAVAIGTLMTVLASVMVLSGSGISLSRALLICGGMAALLSQSSLLSYFVTRACARLGLDPDNLGVPVVCASMDLLASTGFMLLAKLG